MKRRYITTAIDYVNSLPHIGTAYEKIGADVLARFWRMEGDEVRFVMGNDEHSINVLKSAREKKLDPLTYCDQMEARFTDVWKKLNISYDDFIRTTQPRHAKGVSKLIEAITASGHLYPSEYEGWYCESCEAFLTEKDLVDGQCANHKKKPSWIKETNYFFALSKFGDALLAHIRENPQFILPESRRNEIIRLIESGLQDISLSRSGFDWGIPMPHDPSHVVYVWADALVNYITAIGYGTDEKLFNTWWPADLHVIGKDITRFHCVIWPAMLMAAGIPLPKTVFGHGFVYLKGEKMSKSLGNVVTPLDVVDAYGADALRYYLLRDAPFGRDADFTWDNFILRYNSDLANGLGNLVSRASAMIERYFSGAITPSAKPWNADAEALSAQLETSLSTLRTQLDYSTGDIQFNLALGTLMEAVGAVDKYINETKPWALAKAGDTDTLTQVLATVTEGIRLITILTYPFIPTACESIWNQFGFGAHTALSAVRLKADYRWGAHPHALQVTTVKGLFPRIEEKPMTTATTQPTDVTTTPPATEKAPAATNLIGIDDFAKVELRVAKVISAEKVEGADKLLKLHVDLGTETRQIVAGIAKSYAPEALVGKIIVVVANLKPAKLRGIESQGMLLAASDENGIVVLSPESSVAIGSRVK